MINGIEIFSGAGGLATGLSIAGISHKAFVEWNGEACNTLRQNYDPRLIHQGDIRDIHFNQFPNIDFIAGGPPCQPFSLGGKARGHRDCRDMFPEAIRSIRELAPKAFVFENVKGLLRQAFRDYLDYILLQLSYPDITCRDDSWKNHYSTLLKHRNTGNSTGLEYNVSISLVNAADYGIPQKRERIIITGIRKDVCGDWKFPNPTHSHDALLWSKYVSEEYWANHGISPTNDEYATFHTHKKSLLDKYGMFPPTESPWKTIRDALSASPAMTDIDSAEHTIRGGAREYQGHTGSPIDEPAKTIKAGDHGVPGGENMIKFRNGDVRYFTIFEAKRIQTFPDDYIISGSWTEAMRQLGNAVPVELARIIGKSMIDTIFSQS